MQEPTPDMVRTWRETYDTYRPGLKPNRKPIQDVITYLKDNYPVRERTEEDLLQVVIDNVLQNEYSARKIPDHKPPLPQVFQIENTGTGKHLYENQDEIFKGCPIIIGFERESGYFMVEGRSMLWNELFVYCGLDEDDLNNYYLVAEYVALTRLPGDLDGV